MVGIDQAIETFDRTVKDEPWENWADWIKAIQKALETDDTSGLEMYDQWVLDVYKAKNKDGAIHRRPDNVS